jgi:large subunit ribosomal protein L35
MPKRPSSRLSQDGRKMVLISAARLRMSKMPKLKTKSGAKKRFKLTGTGRVKAGQAGKRHGMIKRTAKFVRNARGTTTLSDADAKIVKQFLNG